MSEYDDTERGWLEGRDSRTAQERRDAMPDWEVRITVYHQGELVQISDGWADSASAAVYAAHNDLELWAQTEDASA